MSKFYMKDLERIKNGKEIELDYGYSCSDKSISLAKLDEQIKDLRSIRYYILETFKNDTREAFDRRKGCKIESEKKVEFDPQKLFFSKYLDITIPTMFGDTRCLVSDIGLDSATFKTSEVEEDINLILPYIKGIINVNQKTNVLNDYFYNGIALFNKDYTKVLKVNGDGILLPFDGYLCLSREELQELLRYYYINYEQILKNIYIPDSSILNIFRTNASKQKVLALYNMEAKKR